MATRQTENENNTTVERGELGALPPELIYSFKKITPFFLTLMIPFLIAAGYTAYFGIPIFFGLPSVVIYVLSKGLTVIILLSVLILLLTFIITWLPNSLRKLRNYRKMKIWIRKSTRKWTRKFIRSLRMDQWMSEWIKKGARKVRKWLLTKSSIENRNRIGNLYVYLIISGLLLVEVFWWPNFNPHGKIGLVLKVGFIILLCIVAIYILKKKNIDENRLKDRFIIIMPVLLMFISFGVGLNTAALSDDLYLVTYKKKAGTEEYKPEGICKDKCRVVFIDKDKAFIEVSNKGMPSSITTIVISEENRLIRK